MNTYQLTAPDDWHIHLRDDSFLKVTANDAASSFKRAIIMPNLLPPITNVQMAKGYYTRILESLEPGTQFEPKMTLYLNEEVTPAQVRLAHDEPCVTAIKWYPKGVTTHSEKGISDIKQHYDTLQAMSEANMPLLIHGEVSRNDVDIFEREPLFLKEELAPLIKNFPKLKIVLEHISTQQAVEFVETAPNNVAATITAHHLWINRNDLLSGGIKPHYYCLPIVKKLSDQKALLNAATSGNPKFFLGTDSAPHSQKTKQSACGCAGIYTAPFAIPLYAQCFEKANAIDKLEAFASHFGADFYCLPRNQESITLIKNTWTVPEQLPYGEETLIPFMAGQTLDWQIEGNSHG